MCSAKIGGNLNQIARHLNEEGTFTEGGDGCRGLRMYYKASLDER